MCDDYFFCDEVSNSDVTELVALMQKENIDFVKIASFTGSKKIIAQDYTSSFTVSNGVPTIYKTSSLKEISYACVKNSMRQYEIHGSKFVNQHKDKYKVASACGYKIPTMHCVLEMYWIRKSLKTCQKNGIDISFNTYKNHR